MEKYTDSFLDEKFSVIEEKMDDHFEATTGILRDIKTQTTTTNGRVGKLESWQNRIIGGWMVFSLICIPVLGFLGWKVIELDKELVQVKTSINI